MAEPVSTAQLIARNNVNQLQQARQNIQAPVAAPTEINYGHASNPIGLISSGLSTIGQTLNAPAQQQAKQANMDRAAALQAEQQAYIRNRAAQGDVLNAEHYDTEQAQAKEKLRYERDIAARNYKDNKDKLAKVDFQTHSKLQATTAAADAVSAFKENMAANAKVIAAGGEGLNYQQTMDQIPEMLKSMRKGNRSNENMYDNINVDALETSLKTAVKNQFGLSEPSKNEYAAFDAAQQGVLAAAQKEADVTLNAELLPVDPALSTISSLKIDGGIKGAVHYAVNNMNLGENVDKGEFKTSCAKVVKAVETKFPEYKDNPYWKSVVASAIMDETTDQPWWRDSDDATSSGSPFGSGINSDLSERIQDTMRRLELDKAKVDINAAAQKRHRNAYKQATDTYASNLAGKSVKLHLLQGNKVR